MHYNLWIYYLLGVMFVLSVLVYFVWGIANWKCLSRFKLTGCNYFIDFFNYDSKVELLWHQVFWNKSVNEILAFLFNLLSSISNFLFCFLLIFWIEQYVIVHWYESEYTCGWNAALFTYRKTEPHWRSQPCAVQTSWLTCSGMFWKWPL